MAQTRTERCPRCYIGHLHAGKSTYTRLEAGQFISVPAMPLHSCDICGFREYDEAAVKAVEQLIGLQDSGGEAPARRAAHQGEPPEADTQHGG